MPNILLEEMSHPEIDWMLSIGQRIELTPGTILTTPNHPPELLYVVLAGDLAVDFSSAEQTEQPADWELAGLSNGQIVGAIPFLPEFFPAVTVRSLTSAIVLAIPRSALSQKLEVDCEFAAHFYRASALLLMQRLVNFSRYIGCPVAQLSQMQLREASVVFAELQDSDLDWLIAVGRVQSLAPETLLIQPDRPVDDLNLILEGSVALHLLADSSFVSDKFLSDRGADIGQAFARLSRGDWLGETLAIDAFPPYLAAKTLRETEVLSISKWRLKAKLWHDSEFAARFYRILAILLANKQQRVIQQWTNSTHKSELDNQRLTQITLAEARFEWMLKRIRTQLKTGGILQW